jgi:hypothetical protein
MAVDFERTASLNFFAASFSPFARSTLYRRGAAHPSNLLSRLERKKAGQA